MPSRRDALANRLSRWPCPLEKDLHALKFVVEGALERGIVWQLAVHVADIGRELGVAPREVAPANDLVAP